MAQQGNSAATEAELVNNIRTLFNRRVSEAVQSSNKELIDLHRLTAESNRKLRAEIEEATKVREQLEEKITFMEAEFAKLRKNFEDQGKKQNRQKRKRDCDKEIESLQKSVNEKNAHIIQVAKKLKEISEGLLLPLDFAA